MANFRALQPMRTFLALSLTLISFTFSGKAQKSSTATIRHFSGKIDQYPIEMTISSYAENDSVAGSYYYVKSGSNRYIDLKGTLKNNILDLTESTFQVKNNKLITTISGQFSMQMSADWGLKGSWSNVKGDKKLNVSLNCLENNRSYNPLKNKYKFQQYTINKSTVSYPNWKIDKIKGLDIYNDKGVLIQSLTGFDEFIYERKAEVELEDLNFDGLPDLKIQTYLPEQTKGDIAYLYFLYHPVQKKYIRNPQLEELGVLGFDAKKKLVLKDYADGSGNESTHTFKWLNNKIYLIKTESVFENDDQTHYEEYRIIGNKSVKVKSYKNKG